MAPSPLHAPLGPQDHPPKHWAAKEAGLGEAVGIRDTGGSGPSHLARSPDLGLTTQAVEAGRLRSGVRSALRLCSVQGEEPFSTASPGSHIPTHPVREPFCPFSTLS